jgi:Tol biopolymer transport system component/DNA-binding winged helix-turn-helix (wHTH) protein
MKQIYKFGPFLADLAERQLTQGSQPIPLTPKVFRTLEILLRNRERIVSKRELLSTIWPDCHVEDSNVTQDISVLRKALGETNSGTQFIATFPRQGYRFIGEVEEVEQPALPPPAAPPIAPPAPRRGFRNAWVWGLVLSALTLLAVVVWLVRTEPPIPELGGLRAVTHLPGRGYQPALSPDGTRVAFVLHSDLEGPLRIGVLDLVQTSAPRMIATDEGDAFSPAWSPDGRRLAYLHAYGQTVTLVVQEPEGKPGDLTEVFPESCGVVARRLDWSPDGRFLAVSNKSVADEPFRIELINIAEKRKTVLTTPPELSDGDFQPRFSPDGTKLAFVRSRSTATMDVLFAPIPGGDPVAVTDGKLPCGDVDWTPDSHAVLFTPERDGKSQLYRVPLAQGGKLMKWEPLGERIEGLLQFSASRQTGKVVLAHAQPDQNIWSTQLNAGHGVTGWKRLIASAGEDSFPMYSPDGRRIAFLSDRSGEQQLWIKENDGRERQITFGQLRPGAASWTAKSDVIVFPGLRTRVMYRLALATGQPEPIAVGSVGSHTAVSPDGASVFFVRRFYIMQAPSSGGTPTQVTDQGGFPLRLSTDGKWIYYVRHRYSSEIWRLRRSDGFAERVTDRLKAGCWACWALNSKALVYVATGEDDAARLKRLDLTSGETQDLGKLPGRLPPLGLGMLALSPDDRSLVAVVAEPGTGDIQVAEKTLWRPADTASISAKSAKR